VKVDGTFRTGKYHNTLLTAISQDGNRNIFPLVFAIVEGETKETMIWFFQLLQSPDVAWEEDGLSSVSPDVAWEDGLSSVFRTRHIASNSKFKNTKLKRQLINISMFSFFIFNFKFNH